jgi:LAO/AO transport system kinase
MAKKEYESAISLLTPSTPTWTPPVLTCSALEKTGIDEIWNTVLEHNKKLSTTGELKEKRKKQAIAWMWSMVEEGLKDRFYKNAAITKKLTKTIEEVEQGIATPTVAAFNLLHLLDN